MNKKINKNLKEYSSFSDGQNSKSGGPFGLGNVDQLVVKSLNPATRKIADQTDAETNKNVQDLQYSLGKYKSAVLPPDYEDSSIENYQVDNPSPAIQTRDIGDVSNAMGSGKPNLPNDTLVSPQSFIPSEDPRDRDSYLIDDMTNDVILNAFKNIRKEKDENFINEVGYIDYTTSLYSQPTHLNLNPKDSKETVGHTTIPTATNVSSIGSGAVLLPKAFTPEDQIAKQNNKDPNTGFDNGENSLYDLNKILKDQEVIDQKEKDLQELRKLINKIIKEEIKKNGL